MLVGSLNRCLAASITYHDFLCGLRAGHGTWTTTLEVKLLQQVMAMREAVLHGIFLDMQKEYNTLDRSRFLDIL